MAIEKSSNVPPFVSYCATLIPTVFDNSLSYYEALSALAKWLQDNVVDVINNNATVTEEYIKLVEELKSYVENYFDNLDVQEEINHKLDEMVEGGTLQEIMASYLEANTAWVFDSVASMKSASNLIAGSYAQTTGFYEANDGGKALYRIREPNTGEIADEMFTIAVGGLIAELIIPSELAPEAVGVHGDGTTDTTASLQALVTYASDNGTKIRGTRTYVISDSITVPNGQSVSIKLNKVDATALTTQPAFILDHTRYSTLDIAMIEFTKTTAIDVHGSYSYKSGVLMKGTSYMNVNVEHIKNAHTGFVLYSNGRSGAEGCYYNTIKSDKSDTFNFIHFYTMDGAINGNTVEKGVHIISEWTNTNSVKAYSIINDAHTAGGSVYVNNHNAFHNIMVEKYSNDATAYAVGDLSDLNSSFITVDRIEVLPNLDLNNLITYNANTSYNLLKFNSGWFVIPEGKVTLGNNNYVVSYQNYNRSLENKLYIDTGYGVSLGTNFSAVSNDICDGTITRNPVCSRIRINGLFTSSVDLSANTNYTFCTIGTPGRTCSHGLVYTTTSGNPTALTQIGTIRRVKGQSYCYLRVSEAVTSGTYLYVDFECEY